MNIQKVMTELGFSPSDYEIWGEDFTMTPKTQQVEVSPAEYDEDGNLLFDAVMEEVDLTPTKPSAEVLAAAWEEVQLNETDITVLINAYLEGKERDLENDSLNIVENKIHSWNFTHVPRPSNSDLLALKSGVEQKTSQAEINAAALKFLAESDWMVTRFIETGVEMPHEISEARQDARDRIVRS